MKAFLLLALLLAGTTAMAQTLCQESFGKLPVQTGGRTKPLRVAAEETLRFITGKTRPFEEDGVLSFCKLSFESMGLPSNLDLPVKVEHVDAKKLVGIPDGEASLVYSKLEPQIVEIRGAYQKRKENDSLKKELSKVLSRLQTAEELKRGQIWTSPVISEGKLVWQTLPEFVREDKVQALRAAQTKEPFVQLFEDAKTSYIKQEGDRYMLEHTYYRANLFLWAMLIGILGLAVAFTVKNPNFAYSISTLCILMQLTGMVMRILISGRAPITNMYETVMFSGLGAHIIALGLAIWKKERNFLLAGLGYNVLCLMMMKFANNMLDPAISPLVPVLRDNFWLSTHVTTIIMSYAALALSWLLANIILIRQSFKGATNTEVREQTQQVYTCIKFGVVLLSAGIILGGVWADYSWGRFWGWDPKETWSLIVLLVYMAILHGKHSNWIPPRRFVPLVAGAFMSVMMAWFGVNYILATGLHSYGFSEGGAIFLGSFFAIQIALLIVTGIRLRTQPAGQN